MKELLDRLCEVDPEHFISYGPAIKAKLPVGHSWVGELMSGDVLWWMLQEMRSSFLRMGKEAKLTKPGVALSVILHSDSILLTPMSVVTAYVKWKEAIREGK